MTAPRVLLLVPARTYRAADFLAAASRLGLDLIVGSDGALPLGGRPVVPVSPGDPERSADRIIARTGPAAAVVAADTPMLVLAAVIAGRMGLPHNPVDAVTAACDKAAQRRRWAVARVAQPTFRVVPAAATEDVLRRAAAEVGCPCVVKAASLSASQGVLRADDPAAAVAAARRVREVLATAGRPGPEPLLVEEYVPGPERAVDGQAEAAATPGITGLSITIPAGQRVRPLPDGDRYLGFIFAEGDTQDRVEQALADARDRLRVVIE
ncbi:MAG: ATP-grasp domain-containing protein [Streptosporangiaceae bacterium]